MLMFSVSYEVFFCVQVFLHLCHFFMVHTLVHPGCHRRNGPNFGRVFLMLKYTDITQNTYVQS